MRRRLLSGFLFVNVSLTCAIAAQPVHRAAQVHPSCPGEFNWAQSIVNPAPSLGEQRLDVAVGDSGAADRAASLLLSLGDDCTQPLVVNIPDDLSPVYVDVNTTCGRLNNYSETCLLTYDGGEDIIYELNVAEQACINVELDSDTAWTGLAIHDTCPLDPTTCLYRVANSNNDLELLDVDLAPGTYYLMIDTWAPPACISSFTLTITSCAVGACCDASTEPLGCFIADEPGCIAANGTYVGDFTVCSGEDCNVNGVDDLCDILSGDADDCNNNGIPDTCDLAVGNSDDFNANGYPDECEPDCNANGVVDDCDIDCSIGNCWQAPSCGTAVDCNLNLLPDDCEIADTGEWSLSTTFNANNSSQALMFDLTTKWPIRIFQMDSNMTSEGPVTVEVWYVTDLTSYQGKERIQEAWTLHEAVELPAASGPDLPTAVPFSSELMLPKDATVGILFQINGTLRYNSNIIQSYENDDLRYEEGGIGGPNPLWHSLQFSPRTWNGTIHYHRGTADCNDNGVPDPCDVPPICQDGNRNCSADCQPDLIPDECQLGLTDCNNNGIPDDCDIADDFSSDCNDDGVPDECQLVGNDCQADGIPDECQLGLNDCNANAIPDECDIAAGASADINANGVPDECDPDCNNNGILDDCETDCSIGDCAGVFPDACGTANDCNTNQVPDECEIGSLRGNPPITYAWDDGTLEGFIGIGLDACMFAINHFNVETNGEIIDEVSIAWGPVTAGTPATVYVWSDPNQDGNPADAILVTQQDVTTANPNLQAPDTADFTTYTLDSPVYIGSVGTSFFVGYGIVTTEYPMAADTNGYTGIPDGWILADTGLGCDPNDLDNPNYNNPLGTLAGYGFEANHMIRARGIFGGVGDCNNNGIPDDCDVPPICDGLDCSEDCQGDLIPDECQLGNQDCNTNGIPDSCDIASGTSTDCNENGIPDECDLDDCEDALWCRDCNSNDIPDMCDIDSGFSQDCNANDIPDECDITSGASDDCQLNGIPDECEMYQTRDIVWDNGPLVTHPDAGCNGGDVSALQTDLGLANYGYGAQISTGYRVADDFDVTDPLGCHIDEITFFAYQSLETPPTINAVDIRIWNGEPGGDMSWIVWSSPNALVSATASGIYRARETNLTDCDRHIQELQTAINPPIGLVLVPGTYWLDVSYGSDLANVPWQPPVTELGEVGSGNAMQFNAGIGQWVPLADAGTGDVDAVPFVINGLCGPAPNDCNANDVLDECDISVAFGGECVGAHPASDGPCSSDHNFNAVPDECEDVDNDGDYDTNDFAMLSDCMSGPGVSFEPGCATADLDNDGDVDQADMLLLQRMFTGP